MKRPDISSLSDGGYCHGKKEALFSLRSPRKVNLARCYFFRLCKVLFALDILLSSWLTHCPFTKRFGRSPQANDSLAVIWVMPDVLTLNALSQTRLGNSSSVSKCPIVFRKRLLWSAWIANWRLTTSFFPRQLRLALPVDLCYHSNLSIEVGYYEASRLLSCYKCIWLNFLKLKGVLN